MSLISGPGVRTINVSVSECGVPEQPPVRIQQVSGTNNLLEFYDIAGNLLSFVDNTGGFAGGGTLAGAVILAPASSSRNIIQATGNFIPLSTKAFAGQTADLQQWLNSSGGVVASVTVGGHITGSEVNVGSLAAGAVMSTFTAAPAQSADFIDLNNSSNVTLWSVSAAGFTTTQGISSPGVIVNDERFGSGATANGGAATAVGAGSFATAANTVALGGSAAAQAVGAIAIGKGATSGFTGAISIGPQAITTAGQQLVIGSDNPINISDVYIGSGVTSASPLGTTYNATGGSGTDIAGASLTLAGGKGTGAGAPGNVILQASTALGTGTTLQTLSTVATVSPGAFTVGGTVLKTTGEIDANSSAGTAGQVLTSGGAGVTSAWAGVPSGGVIVLCSAFTPAGTGADTAEVVVPFSPRDGTTSVTWNVQRITLRVQTAGGSPSVRIEKSTATTAFSASTVGDVTMASSGDFEAANTTSLGTVASGNKLRFNVLVLDTAQNWTVEVQIGASI